MGDSLVDLSKLFQPAADVINNLIDKCYDAISKQLINILEMIDAYTADAFKRICKYRIDVKNENGKVSTELLIVDSVRLKEHHINLEYNELDELNNIGLINFTVIGSYEIADAIVSEISYGEVIYKISNRERKNFPTGMVKLTRVGEELVECLVGEFEEEFEMEIENYLSENGYKFEKIKNDG